MNQGKQIPVSQVDYELCQRIIATACDYYQLPQSELLKGRMPRVSTARMMAMFLCTELTEVSIMEIGRLFQKNAASVHYAKRHLPEWLELYAALRADRDHLLTLLTGCEPPKISGEKAQKSQKGNGSNGAETFAPSAPFRGNSNSSNL